MDESLNRATWSGRLPPMNPVRAFVTVLLAVFLLIFLGSALITFMMPDVYTANARVVAPTETDLELFQSTKLMQAVSQRLNLAETLATRYRETKPLDDARVEQVLRRSVQVRRIPKTDFVDVRVSSHSPSESAQWANEIASTGSRLAGKSSVAVIDAATAPHTPSRPNKPLNLFLGAVVGIFLGIMAGGVGAKLAVGFERPGPTKA